MIIVITGSRKGIGRKLCEYYLSKGDIVIGCSRQESDLQNKNYRHYIVDVSKEESVQDFASKVRKEFKAVDILINNAGAASMNHFLFTPPQIAKELMELNYLGAFQCCRAFVNLLKKSQHPRIINFSTIAVPLKLEGELAYAASKSAVEALTKGLAKELSQFKITVNAVGPTPIPTDLIARVPREKLEALKNQQTIKRFGEFEDVINVIDFFIHPKSDFITGQIIYLGGVN
ncbi:MAG: SDR family oxidoreductase, partial [Endomicrobium sp.]|jgi:3-oxoacyl-[acyl-carrier protein] reductase|nr:SDR family oxidoreductase [Endomicrobium sp.]